jgi:hypothetical protein
VSVELDADGLAEAVESFAGVYLLTLGERPHPHVGAVAATVADGVVRVDGVGRTGLRDVAGDDAATLLWVPREPGGYSLIVDGRATIVGDQVEIRPDRAVLHRPAPSPTGEAATGDGACSADCVELPVDRPAPG